MSLKFGKKLGNGRGNDIKAEQDRNCAEMQCLYRFDGYREILQKNIHKGYVADFFVFSKFRSNFWKFRRPLFIRVIKLFG